MNFIEKAIDDLSEEFLNKPYDENTIAVVESRLHSILDDGISKGILKPLPELQVEVDADVENYRLNISVTQKEEHREFIESSKRYDMSHGIFDKRSTLNEYLKVEGFNNISRKYIENKIRNAMRGKDCIDNFRYYHKNIFNQRDKFEYEAQKENGCCGFYDEEIKLKSGRVFVFGFNYGH